MKGELSARPCFVDKYGNPCYSGYEIYEWSEDTGELKAYLKPNGNFKHSNDFVNTVFAPEIEDDKNPPVNGTQESTFSILATLFPNGFPESKSGNIFRLVLDYRGDNYELSDVYCHVYSSYAIKTSYTNRGSMKVFSFGYNWDTRIKYEDRLE